MFWICQFTSFIVKSAARTAKCWCAPPNGKARLARAVVQPSLPRSSPSSLRRPPAAEKHLPARGHRVPADSAARARPTHIDRAKRLGLGGGFSNRDRFFEREKMEPPVGDRAAVDPAQAKRVEF